VGPRLLKTKLFKLMDEAKTQSWGSCIQGLAAFPQVLARLRIWPGRRALGERISRATIGRHALGSAYANAGAGQWQTSIDAAGIGNHQQSGRARCDPFARMLRG
jgi:hypothetical protein